MKNQIRTTTSDPIQQAGSETRPYAPSFIDRFMDLIQRLPGPYWLTLLVLIVLQSIIVHILAWIDGWLSAYTFSPILLMFPVWLWGPLAIMIYLNSISLDALSSLSPLLDIDEERLERLKDEFTTMPARSVILSSVIWSIIYVMLTYVNLEPLAALYGLGPSFMLFLFLEGLVSYSIGSAVYYHSLRQLRLVDRTVKMVRHVNLFHLDPVYAFSRVTSRTGVSWVILLSITLLTYPIDLANAPVLALLALQLLLALAAFVLPLRSVNQHLVAEKRRLIAELNGRIERTLDRLHRCVEESELSEAVQLSSAMNGLNIERSILNDIPTWPWRTGTFNYFLSAIAVPIIVVLVKLFAETLLGG